VFSRDRSIFARLFGAHLLAIAAVTTLPVAPASAQNLFEALFGMPQRPYTPSSASSYVDPRQSNLFGSRTEGPRHSDSGSFGGGTAYCVRLCDGRHFPIQRSSGASPVQVCSSFCPAARMKIFSGSTIERAVASDGTKYSELPNAFLYRTKLVSDCTCNGKDPVGLVTPTTTNDDPTLRTGDIIAGEQGLVAYTGGKRQNAEYTPVESYSGLNTELRSRLSGVKVIPNTPTPVSIPAPPPEDAKAETKPTRSSGNRRVQLER
jgi:Protein of unknown function (DUF2865)